jgi:hypothetical protein
MNTEEKKTKERKYPHIPTTITNTENNETGNI